MTSYHITAASTFLSRQECIQRLNPWDGPGTTLESICPVRLAKKRATCSPAPPKLQFNVIEIKQQRSLGRKFPFCNFHGPTRLSKAQEINTSTHLLFATALQLPLADMRLAY